ncbi:MAG: thermostable hemolysin [Pseudomonadales bacterium]|nr:thermostable hemolysin [Pseudomonadales bacterium]MCP5358543.1 thermostable hemolysin [Pseudomonadales bacterium]
MSATPLSAVRNAPAHPLLCLHLEDAPQRPALEAFVHARYAAAYQANITHFLPFLLATRHEESLQGVVGLRPGASGRFFVEQYLDAPIEQVIASTRGIAVDRSQVIETGNLAASRGGSQLLFVVLAEVLHRAGYRWITFTATGQVISLLHKLCFEPQVLCSADPQRLGEQIRDWGTYYDQRPSVVIGDLEPAHRTLQQNEFVQKLLSLYENEIAELADVLREAREGAVHE